MMRSRVLLVFLLVACDGPSSTADGGVDASVPDPPPPAPFATIDETDRVEIPGLRAHAHVVRVEHDVPHIYAENREDAMRVLGFVMAQDRFFQMDLTSRLGQGTLSEILGDVALEVDLESRQTGSARVTDIYLAAMDEQEAAEADAFADGVNAYIEAVRRRRAAPPVEFELAFALLGARRPVDLMRPWDRRDVAATGATVLYGTSFETGDPRRERAFEGADALFAGATDEVLRRIGLQRDIIDRYAPPNDNRSSEGWGLDTAGRSSQPLIRPPAPREVSLAGPSVPTSLLDRLATSLERVDRRLHPGGHEGWGSNSWAVMGSAATDGRALLAGDGHLPLSIPALFWQYGLDTVLMGDADGLRLRGATIAGLPLMGVGTNGQVAWTQTAYFADVTDWYAEEVVLGENGLPAATRFRGAEQPVQARDEVLVIADVPQLGSEGREETLTRYETFDGRMITAMEGREVTADEELAPGEGRVNMMGTWIVPSDTNEDGVVSAVSFYYGPFDGGSLLRPFREFAEASDVEAYRQAMRHFIGYGGSMMAADAAGSVLYSAYHAVPCRSYLPRDSDSKVWIEGADPRRLLDGTQYGAWRLPLDERGRVDEAAAAAGGTEACAVPFDDWPQALDPERQYVFHANNDPAGIATDNDIFGDPHYIGGPWIEGYRARRIETLLRAEVAAGTGLEAMQTIQGDHHSNLGEDYAALLLEFVEAGRAAATGTPPAGSAEARLAQLFTENQAQLEEVETRITAWIAADFPTPSGVDTFYHSVVGEEPENSVATTIFAHWFPRFVRGVLDDEGIDTRLSPAVTGDTYRTQTIQLLLSGRGPGNPADLGSWNPATEESVFFDDLRTAEVESSDEIGLRALVDALAFLSAEPTSPDRGGFGPSMSEWLWGLRHQVRFESLVGSQLGAAGGDDLGPLLSLFEITTSRLPLATGLSDSDPRAGLTWFPRPGDQFDVDAANPGLDGETFSHGSGPVFRMVIALGPEGVRGENILPGGQSGDPNSPFFDDQAARWLANQTTPMHFLPEEVASGATSRQRFVPAP